MTNLYRLKEELKPMVDDGKITVEQYQDKIESAINQENLIYKNPKNKYLMYFGVLWIGGVLGFYVSKKIKI